MIVRLLFRDRDLQKETALPCCHEDLIEDLGLNTLLDTMAKGDEFTHEICRRVLLDSLIDRDAMIYRQDALKDCIKRRKSIEKLYSIASEALQKEKSIFFWTMNRSPSSILSSSVRLLEMLIESLIELKYFSETERNSFSSEAFTNMFEVILKELTDEYFNQLKTHLKNLQLRNGMLLSARLGRGNRGVAYRLRKQKEQKKWRLTIKRSESYTFRIHERDEAGFRALGELKDKGLKRIAEVLFKSVNHVFGFFKTLKTELAFYRGALNLYDELTIREKPICFPNISTDRARSFDELYNPVLALTKEGKIVGNDGRFENPKLTFITGANQGGKTIFLSSLGIAQIMMQAGLFVCAEDYSSHTSKGIFTHYKREEDKSLKSGKLDEELSRLGRITDFLQEGSLVLFNESFASTNEYEGSEIAKEVLKAFIENGIESIYVTHMYHLTSDPLWKKAKGVFFLKAERTPNGKRTFRIIPGEPSPTSYGVDLFTQIFEEHEN